MNVTTVLADPTLAADVPGNSMSLETELVPGPTLNSEPSIGLALCINTADAATGALDTEIYCQLPLAEATSFAQGILGLIEDSQASRIALLTQALEFKSAQMSCIKGAVGSLTITRIADSNRGSATGFGFFDLDYFDDQADINVLHSIQNIECYVPFLQEEQYEWLRTLVGGNHQFTTTIKVSLVGFTLAEATANFEEAMRRETVQ